MAALRLLPIRTWRPPSSPFLRHASTTASSPSRTALYATLLAVSSGLFAVYYFDSRSAIHRYLFTPLLRYTLDAETGHKFAVRVLSSGLGPRDSQTDDERLKLELWGQQLSNPIGLAAGFDKNAEAVDGLFNLGFSWVEIGSVTPKPQPGNPQPRMFQLPEDSAVINRYGFPSDGHTSVLARLRRRIPVFHTEDDATPASLRSGTVLAVNLGKNKSSAPDSAADFVAGVQTFGPYADILVVNVSSPNTPGLRGMQSSTVLKDLLTSVIKARDELVSAEGVTRRPKLLLKIAPDLDEAQVIDIATTVQNSSVDGVIVSNTTVQRPYRLRSQYKDEAGGLSGTPLKPYSLATLRTLRAHLPTSVPIIGCGGISSGADALEFARAGASAVQVYTSFGYDGVGACRRIKDELTAALRAEGTTWNEVVSRATAELSWKEPAPAPREAPRADEGTVAQLIEEAKELKSLLDGLGERMASSAETGLHVGDSVMAVIPTTT
ncbi:Dihydroorotate dehydrogenase-domain-containing protein [Amylocystis lapponica]|nr:Dihydroorotate dehydrogenase-domain-containing protein [Amylocystis lapponica]